MSRVTCCLQQGELTQLCSSAVGGKIESALVGRKKQTMLEILKSERKRRAVTEEREPSTKGKDVQGRRFFDLFLRMSQVMGT